MAGAIAGSAIGHPRPLAAQAFKVRGNSGCQVSIQVWNGEVFVSKAAIDASYNARLALQIDKQRLARSTNALPFVRIPAILQVGHCDGLLHAEMEYVYFNDCVSHFGAASRPEVDRVTDMVLAYIDAEIAESPILPVSSGVFTDKIESVSNAIAQSGHYAHYQPFIDGLLARLAGTPVLSMPVGRCHGDLTFSNILIAGDSSAVAIIDFLDSFIESPLADLAKLRQDTKFKWSLMMSNTGADRIRFEQVMSYLDDRIAERYSSEDWYVNNINLMMAMNILRISPYAKSRTVHEFLQKSLKSLEGMHD